MKCGLKLFGNIWENINKIDLILIQKYEYLNYWRKNVGAKYKYFTEMFY